jgi:protein-tyrosine phosphatase
MSNAARTAAVVLAAGASSRFGRPKALASLWGRPLLQHVLDLLAATGVPEIVVVLGHDTDEIHGALQWRSERIVRNPDPDRGLSSSLRIGIESLGPASEAALILLGDQPTVPADVVEQLLTVFVSPARPIAVPVYRDGGGSNPLLIHRSAWPLALEASADRGLGPVLRGHRELIAEIDVPGSNLDVDTPEDLAYLEATRMAEGGPNPTRAIQLDSLPNLRDVGGLPARDGRVRTGLLFRSANLNGLEPADAAALEGLGIRTIYDLRTAVERAERPDRVPNGARHVAVDVLDGLEQGAPREIMALMNDAHAGREAFADGKGAEMFFGQYRGFVNLESARRGFGRIFSDLTDERCRPALIHCMGGKDRTGWAVASLLLLLGVPDDLVLEDYMASNTYLRPGFQAFFDDLRSRGGDPDLIASFLWVRPDYLEASLGEMRRDFGTIERYFADGLGLGDGTTGALRATFLE